MSTVESQERFLERIQAFTIVAMDELLQYGGAVNSVLSIASITLKDGVHTLHTSLETAVLLGGGMISSETILRRCVRMTEAVYDAIRTVAKMVAATRFSITY